MLGEVDGVMSDEATEGSKGWASENPARDIKEPDTHSLSTGSLSALHLRTAQQFSEKASASQSATPIDSGLIGLG